MQTPMSGKFSKVGRGLFFAGAVTVASLSPLWATAALADKRPTIQLAAYDSDDARAQKAALQADSDKRKERLEAQIREEKRRLDLKQQAWEERVDRRREALNRSIELKEKRLHEKFRDQKQTDAWQRAGA